MRSISKKYSVFSHIRFWMRCSLLSAIAFLPSRANSEILAIDFDLSVARSSLEQSEPSGHYIGFQVEQIHQSESPETGVLLPVGSDAMSVISRENGSSTKVKKTTWNKVKPFELVYQGLNAIDAIETIACSSRTVCREVNPMLGRKPSVGKVIIVKGLAGVSHYFAARWLAEKEPKWVLPFEYLSIVVQGSVVMLNIEHCF